MLSRDHPHVAVNTKKQGEEEGGSPPAHLLLLHIAVRLLGPSRQAELPCRLLQGRGGQEPTDVHSPLQPKLARKCRDKERGTEVEGKGSRATCLTAISAPNSTEVWPNLSPLGSVKNCLRSLYKQKSLFLEAEGLQLGKIYKCAGLRRPLLQVWL